MIFKQQLWSCRRVSRKQKLRLMFKVWTSSYSWCTGAWTVNSRKLLAFKSAFSKLAKRAMRPPRFWSDSDEVFHRRSNRLLKETTIQCGLPDVEVHLLATMYNYAGHLVRSSCRNQGHLTGRLVKFRCSQWKDALTQIVGHQGHHGRVSPWCWERQFHSYFRELELDWWDLAASREKWLSHRAPWLVSVLGSKSETAILGPYV